MKALVFASLLAAGSVSAFAQAVNVGDLLVYRIGANAGTDTELNTGNAVFLDEWTAAGTYVRTYNTGIFASGTATSEGELNISEDKRYVAFTGYASTAATSLSGTTGTAVNRTVGVLDTTTGTITKTNFTDFASGNNPRAAVTTNGTDLWMTGGAGGVRYYNTILGGASTTQLAPSPTNFRDVQIVNGQLYTSAQTGTTRLATVGTGSPTLAGQTVTSLAGIPTTINATNTNPYAFFFADLNASVAGVDTLYMADDNSTANGGGIQKYSLVGGSWVANGIIPASGSNALRGLTGKITASGVQLYTSFGSSAAVGDGTVYSLLDASGYNSAITGSLASLFTDTTLQTTLGGTGSNYAFRGLVVIPEPSTYALLTGLAGLTVAVLRRRRATAAA